MNHLLMRHPRKNDRAEGVRRLVLALLAAATLGGCVQDREPAREAAAAAGASGSPPAAETALCQHRVPAGLCTRCTPDLAPVFKSQGDWCAEHGVPESQCFECNPNLTFAANQVAKDWCREHAVPESKCTKCHPGLIPAFIAAGDYCRQHEYPASVCPRCHPELVTAAGEQAPVFPPPGTRVVLASVETAIEAGIATRRVERQRFARTLDVVGELEFDQNRRAQLTAAGEALVLEVQADIGDEVGAGQPLVTLASSSVGAEQARLSAAAARLEAARAASDRERGLAQAGVSSKQSAEVARSELAAAQGDYDAARAALDAAGAEPGGTGGRYVLRAPFAGTVVARDAVAGKVASAGHVLLEVADLRTMWAHLDLPEADAGQVRPGQRVRISFEGLRAEARTARIDRVGASVDPASRTVLARVELPNPDRSLKAGVFLRAAIEVAPEHQAILVPLDAIQRAEDCTLVFVKRGPGSYEPVPVELGTAGDGMVEVIAGLTPGDEIVTTGAFLLKTEILKESIGAGCCEVDTKK
jgi:cobalt-zinc-cadmium efflux system membrane fusion protein